MPSFNLPQTIEDVTLTVYPWDQMPLESDIDFNYFMIFCKHDDYTATLRDYCREKFPENPTDMIIMAGQNLWWSRRMAYLRGVRDLVTVSAQAMSAEGVRRVVSLANTIHITTVQRMSEIIKAGDNTSLEYKLALSQFERISKIIISAAAAVNKNETNIVTAVNVENTGATFSKAWDG